MQYIEMLHARSFQGIILKEKIIGRLDTTSDHFAIGYVSQPHLPLEFDSKVVSNTELNTLHPLPSLEQSIKPRTGQEIPD